MRYVIIGEVMRRCDRRWPDLEEARVIVNSWGETFGLGWRGNTPMLL